jgi:polyhydroxyalkanoate synthesis regulator phasin
MDNAQQKNIHKAMFLDLIAMLSTTTMQQMGKIINPMTGKTEINLEAAQATIDMLEMLEAKSRGNLDREEERFIKTSLTSLQMNYVETKAATPAPAPTPAPTPAEETKEPKFHKTYG